MSFMPSMVKSFSSLAQFINESLFRDINPENFHSAFRFIAFVYTYHYLNWFSKTSVIGWKEALNRRSTLLILIIWLGSIGVYLYDYQTGLTALFFLSFLHVLLEFPLNVITIREVAMAPWKKSQTG